MKRHIHSIVFLLIFAVDFTNFCVSLLAYDSEVPILLPVRVAMALALAFTYPLILLIVFCVSIERITDSHKLAISRRILVAYLALDILSGIIVLLIFDTEKYALSLFFPFYSRFGFVVFRNAARQLLSGDIHVDHLLQCILYIAYWLNFALLLRSLSKRIRQGEQTEKSQ